MLECFGLSPRKWLHASYESAWLVGCYRFGYQTARSRVALRDTKLYSWGPGGHVRSLQVTLDDACSDLQNRCTTTVLSRHASAHFTGRTLPGSSRNRSRPREAPLGRRPSRRLLAQ